MLKGEIFIDFNWYKKVCKCKTFMALLKMLFLATPVGTAGETGVNEINL